MHRKNQIQYSLMKENAMSALDPAAIHALSELFIAIAILIGSISPKGLFK
jgi:hypothetical protein